MRWSSVCVAVLSVACAVAVARGAVIEEQRQPLTDTVLFSLVVGDALPENIVHEIQVRGLAFQPSDAYRSALSAAGADSKLLGAIQKAKIVAKGTANLSSADSIKHLAAAGKLLQAEKYEEASHELAAAADYGDGTEAAFVMGAVLRAQNKWPEARAVYEEILQRNPDFPQARTKLIYILSQLNDLDGALREGKAELEEFPDNAEAHKDMAFALVLDGKYEAALQHYKEALSIKPDYAVVHFDIGVMLDEKGDRKAGIEAYREALALKPNDRELHSFDPYAHYRLALDLDGQGDFAGAIRESQEAKRGSPSNFDFQLEVARVLMDAKQNGDAVREYRELTKMAPDSADAHFELAYALEQTTDIPEAQKEYRKAIELRPSYVAAMLNLAGLEEFQKHYDTEMALCRRAAELNNDLPQVHRCLGQVFLKEKNYTAAIPELKRAESLGPGDWYTHDLYAQALRATGQVQPAIDELKQAITLDPGDRRERVEIELASALEKSGDWAGAMDQYRKTSISGWGFRRPGELDPSREYKSAQERFQKHLAALRAAGNATEAARLEEAVANLSVNATLSQQLDAALQSGFDAMRSGQANDAMQYYKQAVDLAEEIQPHDQRLPVALKTLGLLYRSQNRFDEASAVYGRETKAIEEVSGPQSPDLADPLENLGMIALQQKNYKEAEDDFVRAKGFVEKMLGPETVPVATALRMMAQVYFVQQDYAHAIPLLEQAVKIHGKTDFSGDDAPIALYHLCTLYDRTNKHEQGAACHEQLVGVLSRLYSPDNPVLADDLTAEAKDLRALGRNDEAAKIDDRIKHLKPSTAEQASDVKR